MSFKLYILILHVQLLFDKSSTAIFSAFSVDHNWNGGSAKPEPGLRLLINNNK